VSEDDLVGGVGLIWNLLEPQSQVETRRLRVTGPQPHPGELPPGMFDEGHDEDTTDSRAPNLRGDKNVANPTYVRIVEIGVPIQTTDPHESGVEPSLQGHLTGPVESVGTVLPVVDEPLHQIVTLFATDTEENLDVIREGFEGLDNETCDHVTGIV